MESTGSPGTHQPDEAPAPQETRPSPPAAPAAPPPVEATPPPSAPAASTSPAWLNTITSSQTVAGPAGMAYADVPSRIFAYIIDAVIMGIGFFLVNMIFAALFFSSLLTGGFGLMSFVWFVVLLLIYAGGSAIYFIYTWTKMRGSPGQRVLGLETLNAADGAALTQPQAIRRWLFLFGPFVLASALSLIGVFGTLGSLLSLLLWVYGLYLLYTAANSPTRQGFHDVQASTVVVKIKK
jgi:uncharacterized RDD family membrane protein YckC